MRTGSTTAALIVSGLVLVLIPLLACGQANFTAGDAGDGGGPGGAAGSGGAPGDFTSCSAPGDCVLATPGCCAACGSSQATAVRRDATTAYRASTCSDPSMAACPGCMSMPDPNIQAFCIVLQGKCSVIDVRQTAVSDCNNDADCVLRTSQCCECGGPPESYVALAAFAVPEFRRQVCAPGASAMACGQCRSTPPQNAEARCASHHCVLRRTAGPGN